MKHEEMQAVDVRTVDKETLVDIRDIIIEEGASKESRIESFVRQVGNPYCFRVGDIVVKSSYSKEGHTLEECFLELLNSI